MPRVARLAPLFILALSAAAQREQQHVLVLHDSAGSGSAEQIVGIFAKIGVQEKQAMQLMERVSKKGAAAVVAGSKESCEQIAKLFDEVAMRTEIRPMVPADTPSEFDDSGVELLDEATFLRELWGNDANQAALVMFFAPWCGHCKKMVPELKKAALKLRGGVRVVAVDCDQAPTLTKKLGIKGFPTVKFVSRGSGVDYQGPRSALALVSFAQSRMRLAGVKASVINAFGGVRVAMSRVLGARPATAVGSVGSARSEHRAE
mmetsp:Transcript_2669/g.6015  ORF Transcript_2669/g.6015 Transcript_2669/m.6015 type:complete len:261 (-) Transcript_2669:242-1024(-)